MELCPVPQRELYEPVLVGHAEESSPGTAFPEPCRRAVRWIRLSLSDWLADSTTESYLDSTLSRRRFWHKSVPAIEALSLLIDLQGGVSAFVIIDIVLLISSVLVTNLMPRQRLKADFVLSSVMALGTVCGLLAARCGHAYEQGSDASESEILWAWMEVGNFNLVMYMGMHSSTTVVALCTLVLISVIVAPSAALPFAAGACLAATTGVTSERWLAESHKYHVALTTVLDCCSDGILCISVPAGIIRSANGKMHDTWLGRLLSQESPTPRALKQSRTKTTSLFSSHTQNTPQSKKDVLLYHFHRRENRPKINPPKAIG